MSAVVLKPAPKAEDTALLLGFVSIFCYDTYVKKYFVLGVFVRSYDIMVQFVEPHCSTGNE